MIEFQETKQKKAIFFDRDGVINESPSIKQRYLRQWQDFRFIEGMPKVLAKVKARGFLTILVTNQQGVGKGIMTMEELTGLHEEMQSALATQGAAFDAIYVATGLENEDGRRKPSPAMLMEAAEEHAIDLAYSWFVGDHDNDMRAGRAAGVGTIRMEGHKDIKAPSDYQVADAAELWSMLEGLTL
ncbi:MAG: D-glycero-D-manno-heptose 1,7-bisphosphate phosphatase [Verrucomicrobiales bacterium]|jgi:D-glycero-D-manno-heptose 1,7-bisphosphate phosphatase